MQRGKIMHSERVSLKEKGCYGIGALSYTVEMMVVLNYLMLYCSDVLKINAAIIGTFMMVVKIFDAVTDVVITSLADRTNTKWGKYRVWILNGIPLAIVLILMFSNPGFLHTETAKIIWICIMYTILVPIFETAMNGPYLALVVTMTENVKDRLDFSNIRALGEAGAAVIVSSIVMPVLLHFGGYRNPMGWRVMSFIIAGVIIITALIGFFGTKERIKIDYSQESGNQMTFLQKTKYLKGVAPFWKLVTMIVLIMFQFYGSSSLFNYFCIHSLGHADWVSSLTSIGFGFQVGITILLFYLGRKFDKRTLLLWGGIFMLSADAILYFATNYTMAAAYQILWGIGNGIYNGMAFAMLPDVTDYIEWKQGVALPGAITAIVNFCLKLGAAFATFLAGQVLVWAQYDATIELQSEFTRSILRLSIPVLSGVCILITVLLTYSLKELSTKDLERYRIEINARNK